MFDFITWLLLASFWGTATAEILKCIKLRAINQRPPESRINMLRQSAVIDPLMDARPSNLLSDCRLRNGQHLRNLKCFLRFFLHRDKENP